MRKIISLGFLIVGLTFLSTATSYGAYEIRSVSVAVSGTEVSVAWKVANSTAKPTYQVELTPIGDTNPKLTIYKAQAAKITIKKLVPWKSYSLRIRALVGASTYAWSKKIIFETTQAPIKAIAAKETSYTSTKISWSATKGATAYKVFVDGKEVATTPTTEYELKSLDVGRSYSVTVASLRGSQTSPQSVKSSVTTLSDGPASITHLATTNTSTKIEWAAVIGADDYDIYIWDGGSGDPKFFQRTKSLSATINKLSPGKTYVAYVAARFGEKPTSRTSSKFSTSAEVPSGLALVEATTSTLSISWKGSESFSKYNVYRDSALVATVATPKHVVTGMNPGQTVKIWVTGLEDDIESSASNVIVANTQVTTPAAPTISSTTALSATVRWAVDSSASSYVVRIFDQASSTQIMTNTVTGSASSTIFSSLAPDTSYFATIAIVYPSATTPQSLATQFTTAKPAPTALTLSAITTSSATLTWDPVPGVDTSISYEFSRDLGTGINLTTNSFNITGLSPGVTYSLRVRSSFLNNQKIRVYSDWSTIALTTLTDPSGKPFNTVLPSYTYTAQYTGVTDVVGVTLTATNGSWTPTLPAITSYSYQWQRSVDGGSNWANINGATAVSYILAEPDYGFRVRVSVTARNVNGSTTANSAPTSAVGTIANVQTPIVRGNLVVGEILTATQGVWYSKDPLSFSYQWYVNGSPVSGETSATYTLADGDVADSVRVEVMARSSLGTLLALSPTRSNVAAILSTAPPVVTGSTRVTQDLTTSNGTWLNLPDSFSYQWEQSSDGVFWDSIAGANSSTFTLTSGQVGKYVRAQVRASKAIGSTYTEVVYSASTAIITGPQVVIANTSAPVISGPWTTGSALTASQGSWSASGTIAYQWQELVNATDNPDLNASWQDISGATNSSYTLLSAQNGKNIRVKVTITSVTGSGIAFSAYTRKVNAPYNTAAPAVTGAVRVGALQTTTNGTWSNTPTSHTYQWQTSADGISWIDVVGATSPTYTPTFEQGNLRLRVAVTATNAIDASTAYSNIVSGLQPPIATVVPVVSGTVEVGETLTTTSGTWPEASSGYAYVWQRSTDGITWTNIGGAFTDTYVLLGSDEGYRIRSQVSLSTNAGTSASYSLATIPVAP